MPALCIHTLVWMARISEELNTKAIGLGLEGPFTSRWHMFGLPLMGPAAAAHRFFGALNRTEAGLNRRGKTGEG